MDKKTPYSSMKLTPFEVAEILGMTLMPGELFKKITCAGIAGRKKSFAEDVSDAIFTAELMLEKINGGYQFRVADVKPEFCANDFFTDNYYLNTAIERLLDSAVFGYTAERMASIINNLKRIDTHECTTAKFASLGMQKCVDCGKIKPLDLKIEHQR
jgi:hypothetical protein